MTRENSPDNSSYASAQNQSKLLLTGVSILGFSPESSARAAGMEKGDLIIEYDGVGNLTTEKLTALTATTRLAGSEIRVVFLRDGHEHSLRLPSGPLGISAMDTTIQGSVELKVAKAKIERIIQIIQRVYLVIAVLLILGVPSALISSSGFGHVLQDVLFVALYGSAYFGLRHRREWATTLVLIVSAFSCISGVVNVIQPAGGIKELFVKVFFLFWLLFFAYQIVFFRRADVRRLFGDKGTLVF